MLKPVQTKLEKSSIFERLSLLTPQKLSQNCIPLALLQQTENELCRRRIVRHSNIFPLWHYGEQIRNVLLWRNGLSIADAFDLETVVDTKGLITKALSWAGYDDTSVGEGHSGSNNFLEELGLGSTSHEQQNLQIRYFAEVSEYLKILTPHIHALWLGVDLVTSSKKPLLVIPLDKTQP